MLQLSPSILVKTPNGEGKAILVVNHGSTHPLEWVVINPKTGDLESWRTQDIKYFVPPPPSWLDSSPPAAPMSYTTVQNQTLVI